MQLTPRYDGPPLLRSTCPIGDPSVPLGRQRRRLGAVLGALDDEQWAGPTRCEGWSVRDVVAHLVDTDRFWSFSASAALAGEPSRFLAGFDPVATPAQLVAAKPDRPAVILDQFREGTEALLATLTGLDEAQWSMPAEAPPGHLPLHLMAHHALWDGWIHERDIVLPLGLATAEEADELLGCLRYAAALGPGFLAMHGSERPGALVLHGTDPELTVAIELGATVVVGPTPAPGAVTISGPTVALIEGLSFRGPMPEPIAEDDRWMFEGLAAVFDQAAPR